MKKFLLFTLTVSIFASFSIPVTYAQVDENYLGYKILAKHNKKELIETVQEIQLLEFDTFHILLKNQNSPIDVVLEALNAPEESNDTNFPKQFTEEGKARIQELFTRANNITISAPNSKKVDIHNRYIANIWIDGILLQEILITEGYAMIDENQINNYLFSQALIDSQEYAQRNQIAIWNNNNSSYTTPIGFSSNYSEPNNQEVAPQAAASVYYKNCSAARAAGAAPVYSSDPGYGSHLDRDGDGIGCE